MQVPTPQSSHDHGIALERLMEERGLPTAASTGEASTLLPHRRHVFSAALITLFSAPLQLQEIVHLNCAPVS